MTPNEYEELRQDILAEERLDSFRDCSTRRTYV